MFAKRKSEASNHEPAVGSYETARLSSYFPERNDRRRIGLARLVREALHADLPGVAQDMVHIDARAEIPGIELDVNQVPLHGFVGPWIANQPSADPGRTGTGVRLRLTGGFLPRFAHATSFEGLSRLIHDPPSSRSEKESWSTSSMTVEAQSRGK